MLSTLQISWLILLNKCQVWLHYNEGKSGHDFRINNFINQNSDIRLGQLKIIFNYFIKTITYFSVFLAILNTLLLLTYLFLTSKHYVSYWRNNICKCLIFLEKYKEVNAHLSILVLNLNTKKVVFLYKFLQFFLCKDIYIFTHK